MNKRNWSVCQDKQPINSLIGFTVFPSYNVIIKKTNHTGKKYFKVIIECVSKTFSLLPHMPEWRLEIPGPNPLPLSPHYTYYVCNNFQHLSHEKVNLRATFGKYSRNHCHRLGGDSIHFRATNWAFLVGYLPIQCKTLCSNSHNDWSIIWVVWC